MPDKKNIEELAIMKLLKVFSDLQAAKSGVRKALQDVKTLKKDIRFEQRMSEDSGARDRMEASSMTVDYLVIELKIIDNFFRGLK